MKDDNEVEEYKDPERIKLIRILLIQVCGFVLALAAFKLSDAILVIGAKVVLVIGGLAFLFWGYLLLRKFKKETKNTDRGK